MANTKPLLFSFEDLSSKDKSLRKIQREFVRLGATVAQTEINPTIKRAAGETFREVSVAFADSQTVTFCVKRSGDIFRVKLNKKDFPVKNQDDQIKCLTEIVDAMEKGRAAFQKKLARVRITPPKGLKSTVVKREAALAKQREEMTALITEAKTRFEDGQKRIEQLTAEVNALKAKA